MPAARSAKRSEASPTTACGDHVDGAGPGALVTYGGCKASGPGCAGVRHSLEALAELEWVCIDPGEDTAA